MTMTMLTPLLMVRTLVTFLMVCHHHDDNVVVDDDDGGDDDGCKR